MQKYKGCKIIKITGHKVDRKKGLELEGKQDLYQCQWEKYKSWETASTVEASAAGRNALKQFKVSGGVLFDINSPMPF